MTDVTTGGSCTEASTASGSAGQQLQPLLTGKVAVLLRFLQRCQVGAWDPLPALECSTATRSIIFLTSGPSSVWRCLPLCRGGQLRAGVHAQAGTEQAMPEG